MQQSHDLSHPGRIGADVDREFLTGCDPAGVKQIYKGVYRKGKFSCHRYALIRGAPLPEVRLFPAQGGGQTTVSLCRSEAEEKRSEEQNDFFRTVTRFSKII